VNIKGKHLKIITLFLVAVLLGTGGFAAGDAFASDTCNPCIALTKTGPDTARPGETIYYHFAVTNCGDVLLGSGAAVYDFMMTPSMLWFGDLAPGQTVEFDQAYTIPFDVCGDYLNIGWAMGHADQSIPACVGVDQVIECATHTVFVDCDNDSPGTGTPGYWMNHPEAWPVGTITIGGVTYSMDDAIAIMQMPVSGDKTFTMFPALVAAKLNVLIGNDSSCIDATIAAADEWMAQYGPAGSNVEASSYAWQIGETLSNMLDDYNNGLLCAPERD